MTGVTTVGMTAVTAARTVGTVVDCREPPPACR